MPMQKRPTIDLMAGLNCLFKVRKGGKKACSVHVKFNEKNDGGKTTQSAHVTMSIRDDGGKTPQSAHVNLGTSAGTGVL